MDKRIAVKKERVVAGLKKDFFYNPMWHYFGNFDEEVLGSYFYNSSKPIKLLLEHV